MNAANTDAPLNAEWMCHSFQLRRWGKSPFWPEGLKAGREYFRRMVRDYTLWFIHHGSGTLIDQRTGKQYELTEGSCLMMQPEVDLELEGKPHVLATYFHWDIPGHGTQDEPFPMLSIPFCYPVVDVAYFAQATHHLVELLNRNLKFPEGQLSPEAHAAGEALLKSLLMEITLEERKPRKTTHQEMTLERLNAAMRAAPQRFQSVKEMAAFCGYSMSHFRAICQSTLKQTPAAILIRSRVNHAKEYLRHSQLTIGMIAETVGYENIYYFSNQFRKVTGMTPTEYRNLNDE